MPTWDIFCAVVDNYGDIGVTWRLARQLAGEYGCAVRLWVDDVGALQTLWPAADAEADEQRIAGVQVRRWRREFPAVEPADVVVEAFACALPASYIEAMAARARSPVWINLEYLSAEPWATDCHGLPSPQPSGLQKTFFFPGFGPDTGGVPGERDLTARRRAFQADVAAGRAFLAALGVDAIAPGTRLVSLFAYENAALPALLEQWAQGSQPVLCLVPEGRISAQAARFFGAATLPAGARLQRGALTAAGLPFLPQDDYDQLLWSCDLNCVRGEDSFVRAQWAGRPFIWHIYPQNDGAHWPKLDAFITVYSAGLAAPAATALTWCWHAWNGPGDMAAAWSHWNREWPVLSAHAEHWAQQLAAAENLAARLVQFCANRV